MDTNMEHIPARSRTASAISDLIQEHEHSYQFSGGSDEWRYRRAALVALEDGDVDIAAVLAQLYVGIRTRYAQVPA
jgi:hypothetical protein